MNVGEYLESVKKIEEHLTKEGLIDRCLDVAVKYGNHVRNVHEYRTETIDRFEDETVLIKYTTGGGYGNISRIELHLKAESGYALEAEISGTEPGKKFFRDEKSEQKLPLPFVEPWSVEVYKNGDWEGYLSQIIATDNFKVEREEQRKLAIKKIGEEKLKADLEKKISNSSADRFSF
ncbi:hypothetical protein J4474_04875 [Candidatus Pacearchaeota archaeon]|nr:hypothetical protein [Candidatus Pacearchaeota archaeon]